MSATTGVSDMGTAAVASSRPLFMRANPLSKMGAALLITVGLLVSFDPFSAGTVVVLEVSVLPSCGVGLGVVARRMVPVVGAAVVAGYGTALLAEKTGAVWAAWGPFVVTSGSAYAALAIVLRSLALALPALILLVSTDPTDVADALAQRLRLPAALVIASLAAMRLVGLLVAQWRTLTLARRARGVGRGGGLYSRAVVGARQAVVLFVQAIRRAGRLAVAMEARGLGQGVRTWARPSTFSWVDVVVLVGGVVVVAAGWMMAIVVGAWNPPFGGGGQWGG